MSKSYNIISMVGAVLLLAGAVLQITRWELAPYLYTLGAVMFGYVQVMGNRYDGRNFIIKRLRRQQIFRGCRTGLYRSIDVYHET